MVKTLILGNSPSLKNFNLELISSYDYVIVCNHWYATDFASKIEVDYYCASDPRLFFPPNLRWLYEVRKLSPNHVVIPTRTSFLKWFFKKTLTYKYEGHRKIWLENNVVLDFKSPLPSGDTVVCDVMIPLAYTLGSKVIHFAGVDLFHEKGAEHAYSEAKVGKRRQPDDYLTGIWQNNSCKSLELQLIELEKRDVNFKFITGKYVNVENSEDFIKLSTV